jgi:hypothetical protein
MEFHTNQQLFQFLYHFFRMYKYMSAIQEWIMLLKNGSLLIQYFVVFLSYINSFISRAYGLTILYVAFYFL